MSLYEKIVAGEEKIALVGLGYVGMPIAVAFARKVKVVGFDLNAAKIDLYKNGIDPTNEVGNDVIKNTTVEFTADPAKLKEAKFHIVAVPTPVNDDHTPDLTPVEGASRLLGQNLTKGSIVVFESTVYPGVTESCPRCLLRSRFEKYENGFVNDVDSAACTIFATERMNALKGYIALMMLMYHEEGAGEFGTMLDEVKNRKTSVIRKT